MMEKEFRFNKNNVCLNHNVIEVWESHVCNGHAKKTATQSVKLYWKHVRRLENIFLSTNGHQVQTTLITRYTTILRNSSNFLTI